MKKIVAFLMLALIVRVYAGGGLVGVYKIANTRDIYPISFSKGSSEVTAMYIDCIDKPRHCGVTIIGPAVFVIDDENKWKE